MNSKLRQNIDFAISRFEASDITAIIEVYSRSPSFLLKRPDGPSPLQQLEAQLNNIRLVHALLSEHISLDSFDQMFNEANESTSLVSFHGRIILHVHTPPLSSLIKPFFTHRRPCLHQTIFELVYDFFPNFNFNAISNRFVRSPIKGNDVPRESMPKPKVNFMYGPKVSP